MKSFFKLALTLCILIPFFTACDAFVLLPAFNHHPDDPNQAFGPLRAGIVDDGTIRVMWDWYDLERVIRGFEPVYDEIVIKHNRGNYPDSRLGGKSFEIKNWDPATNPLWPATFSDLKNDREHYFALYAHEKDGRWVGPMYNSTYMEGFEYDAWSSSPSHSISAVISTRATPGTGLGTISGDEADLYYYQDFWEDEVIMSAELVLEFTSIPADDTVFIYPLRSYIEDADTDNLIDQGIGLAEFSVDRSIRIEVPLVAGGTGTQLVDITKVLAKSQYHHHNGILLKMTRGT
ncbi:MAG: hypothetical protein U5P10_11795 [Spirochaetia bacterium]|nr:hypothetical protein [Spirochaetia bacterium]